jgi:hypothetical protein
MSHDDSEFLCSICFKPIQLERCKIDEDGRPVHELCYVELMHSIPLHKDARHEGWRDWGRKLTRFVGLR